MFERLTNRWHAQGGYRELLVVALPLIVSTSTTSVQLFMDAMFLSWHNDDALAAVVPASMLNFTTMALVLFTVGYVSTFVAQYLGAGRLERIGLATWQGVFVSLAAGVVYLGFVPFAYGVMRWIASGHTETVAHMEGVYFSRLFYGAWAMFVMHALSGFFSGQGKTVIVMLVSLAVMACNVVLNYLWIFGHWIFPEWGIAGAAWATNVSHMVGCGLYLALFLRRRYRQRYGTVSGFRIDWPLAGRLIWFGGPNGLHVFMDVLAFGLFMVLMGNVGEAQGQASALAFRVNSLAFMPMIGIGIAVTVLAGRYLTSDRTDRAETVTWSGLHLCTAYMVTIAVLYVVVPELFVDLFKTEPRARAFALNLLRFVALYSVVDSGNIVFSSALRGAGDTRFVALMAMTLAWCMMLLPAYLVVHYQEAVASWLETAELPTMDPLYLAWTFATLYVMVLAVGFWLRFRTGRWKHMRVIEWETPPSMVPTAEAPVTDLPPD
ncbi:MAG: MATE family efflux transporter [Planctomycetota bacterium]